MITEQFPPWDALLEEKESHPHFSLMTFQHNGTEANVLNLQCHFASFTGIGYIFSPLWKLCMLALLFPPHTDLYLLVLFIKI